MSVAGYFLSVLFCLLSMLISDSRFDLVWFRLSCDHGWIRSGSVNVRKQQQQQWAIALQSYAFTVEHKLGKLSIIPDTLSRLFNFEHSEMRVAPHLAPICRNVPDNPALHRPPRLSPYQANSHNFDEIQPVESDREFCSSATDVFMFIDSERFRQAQQAEFGPYFEYLSDPSKQPPSSESRTFMPYYRENGGLLYTYEVGLISPVIFVKEVRSTINL